MGRFLITGGAGFIGSHLCDALAAEGHELVVLDDFSSGKRANLSGIGTANLIEGDIRDGIDAAAVGPVDAVIHLAALISGYDSLLEPHDYVRANIDGLLQVIRFAAEAKVPRILFASSSTVYGAAAGEGLSEDVLPQPLSVYAATKLMGEHLLDMYGRLHGFSHCSLRLFNVYGPRQATDHPYANVTCKFSHAAANGLPVELFGDGEQSRDFVYVDDVVRAFLLALRGAPSPIYNIGTGRHTPIRALITALEHISGHPNRIERVEGGAWIEPAHSLVVVPGRRLLESSRGVHREIEPSGDAPPAGASVRKVDSLVHFDGFLGANLWHLFADSLNPLLWLRRLGRIDPGTPVLIHRRLWDSPHVRHHLDLPELAGIEWLVQEPDQWVRAGRVIKASATHAEFANTHALLRGEAAAGRPHRRIFLDRRARYRRRIENDGAILPLLASRGFEQVFAEDLSYAEQVQLFRETRFLVGLHGAGLTNMLHSDARELRVLEILTETYLMPHYYWLSQSLCVAYYDALVGSPLNWRGNYRLDPGAFERRLDALLDG